MEKSLFIDFEKGRSLFVTFFVPEKNDLGQAVVICQPVAEERSRSKRILVNLSRHLSRAGFLVVLFDYFGEGDSGGNFEDADIETRINDVVLCSNYVKSNFAVKMVHLVGFRLGGTLALSAILRNPEAGKLILIQPVISGKEYLMEWLKINLSAQLVLSKKIISNRTRLLEDIANGLIVENAGYVLCKRFCEQLQAVDLSRLIVQAPRTINLIEFVDKSRVFYDRDIAGITVGSLRYETIVSNCFWQTLKLYNPDFVSLNHSVCRMLLS